MTSADDTEPAPGGGAVSPAIGPLPAIYVPSAPGQACGTGLRSIGRFWHAAVRAARTTTSSTRPAYIRAAQDQVNRGYAVKRAL